jgi:hypothetical protein
MIERMNKKFVSNNNSISKKNFSSVNVDSKHTDEKQPSVLNQDSEIIELLN